MVAISRQIGKFINAIVVKGAGDTLKPPVDWKLAWSNKNGGGKKDGSLWIPISPEGYKALGCIGVYQNNSLSAPKDSTKSSFMCVKDEFLEETE